MADWLNLNPPPVGLEDPTPLYVRGVGPIPVAVPADLFEPDRGVGTYFPWNDHARECGASAPGYWTWHGDTCDLMVPCTCGGPTDPVLARPAPRLEQDAEPGLHVPSPPPERSFLGRTWDRFCDRIFEEPHP